MSIFLAIVIPILCVPEAASTKYSIQMPNRALFEHTSQVLSPEYKLRLKDKQPGMSSHFRFEEIIVIVQSENRQPVLSPIGNKKIKAGETLTIVIAASDPDGDPLVYSVRNLPTHAAFISGTKTFAWTPTQEQVGVHRVRFIVTDNGKPFKLDFEEIMITVTPGSLPPIFLPVGPT
jgi:hypothetical protein